MKSASALLAAFTASLALVATAQPASPGTLAHFVSWFGGEWNNNEQVWQQKADAQKAKQDPIADPIFHTHHIFTPVSAPKVGTHVFYVQQHRGGVNEPPYRQRIYRFSEDGPAGIKLVIYNTPDDKAYLNAHLNPALFAQLDAAALRTLPGCEVFWRWQAAENAYIGRMKTDACAYHSERLGKRILINDTLKLTDSEIWINDQARDADGNHVFGSKTDTPVKSRKVRYFTGWAYLNKAGPAGKAGDGNFSFRRDLLLHSEGQIIALRYEDGSESPYLLELAQLTYQNTRQPILKMALLDRETKKSLTYIWANTDATRIGLNMGWVQVGLTQKPQRVAFGFGDAPTSAAPAKTEAK